MTRSGAVAGSPKSHGHCVNHTARGKAWQHSPPRPTLARACATLLARLTLARAGRTSSVYPKGSRLTRFCSWASVCVISVRDPT